MKCATKSCIIEHKSNKCMSTFDFLNIELLIYGHLNISS